MQPHLKTGDNMDANVSITLPLYRPAVFESMVDEFSSALASRGIHGGS